MLRDYSIAAIPAGLVIDVNGQCKDAEGNPIPGLFAAGNCSGPFYSDTTTRCRPWACLSAAA